MLSRKICFSFLVLGINICISGCKAPSPDSNLSSNAMVVTAHPKASGVGKAILKEGGNAIDAAIATQFALAVVYPTAGNIGGGGFMVTRFNQKVTTLDFRERAPLKASRKTYQNASGAVKEKQSLKGHLAAGVPGTVAGMVKAHERWGSIPFDQLLEPAITLAKKGFSVTERQAERINNHLGAIRSHSTFAPTPFLRSRAWKQTDTLKRPDLAKTLKRIQEHKTAGFYQGKTARYIINEMERCGGLITEKDLRTYMAQFRDPIVTAFKGFKVYAMPPPSSGGIALSQLLNLVERYPLDKWGLKSWKTRHIMTEAMKLVYADRTKYLGDPAFYDVPKKKLLDSAYLSDRRQLMGVNKTIKSKNLEAGKFNSKIGGQTTHFSIVDEAGNAVSVTTTLNTPYGSKVYVGRAGFFLNSEMNDFSLKPGFPNVYGLRSGEANAIEPGKRMLSSMTPTIVTKADSLYAVLGSPGGSTIITTVFQTLMNITVFNMPMQEAVNHGRFHHQWKPNYLLMEYNRPFQISTLMKLYGKGHWVVPFPPIGSVDAIKVKGDGNLAGGADPRGDDAVMGY